MRLSGDIRDVFCAIQDWLRSSSPIDESGPSSAGPPVSFVDLWQRVAVGGMDELTRSLPAELAAHYRTDRKAWAEYRDIHRDLSDDLATRLSVVGEPAVWEQFNCRRTARDVVMAHLGSHGRGCSRAIYCSVLEELRSDGLQWLTEKYPVLRRHLAVTVAHWLSSTREILTRVHRDHQLLATTFDLPVDARLTGIRQNLSDPHRGGRRISLLTFASEACSPRAVVYKPKDLRIDQAFNRLISEVAAPTPADGPLQSVTVVACAGYGYMEYVPHKICASDQELRSFYRNTGRLTAILYLLGCNDCHNENLIAHRDQLLLVDAETLFQGTPYERNTDWRSSTVRNDMYDRIGNSVVRIGLLPQWYFVGGQRTPRDVSALGIQPPQSEQQQGVGWIELNTDGMVSGRVERAAHLPTSLPVGIGSHNRLSDFAEDFCDGFESQLAKISADKARWLGDSGYLARFRTYRSRFIRRETWVYQWMLRQQSEPAALSSESDQQLLLWDLAPSDDPFSTRPSKQRLFAAEVTQLENLDVPFFEQSIDGVDLIAPDELPMADYFEVSGYDNVRQKLQRLDTASIDLQLALIRGVIAAKNMHAHRGSQSDQSLAGGRLHQPSVEERLNEAAAVGDLLVRMAVTDNTGAVEWLGIDVAEDVERSSYGPLGLSLYGGRSGIAVFLAALALEDGSNSNAYRQTALGGCSDLQKLLTDRRAANEGDRWWRDQPLGLSGSGGVLLALVHLRDLLPDLARPVADGLSALLDALDTQLLRSDQQLDLIYGCAGLIGPLLKIATPRALLLAQEAGDTLVDRQDACGGWVIRSIGSTALTGFSHGASGMAAALARLHAATGRSIYLEAAAKAVRYERRHFHPGVRNWPDFRGHERPGTPEFMLSWCHGAPGIALSRLCMSQTPLWDADVEQDLHHALHSTADQTLAGDSLCCGRFGRAAILRMAAKQQDERRWLDVAVQLEGQGLTRKHTDGAYSFRDVPGLFQGAAGVGLALLDGIRGETSSLLPSILSAGLYNIGPGNDASFLEPSEKRT
jgi:type 2 lantibiotic biosynthesis protein LanM